MSQTIFLELRQESLLLSLLSLENKRSLQQSTLSNTQFRFNNSFDFLENFIQTNLLRSSRN